MHETMRQSDRRLWAALGLISVAVCYMAVSVYSRGTGYSVVWVTAPSEEVAEQLAKGLVNDRHAACVNILPKITSVYSWKGEVHKDPEVLLMIKTRSEAVRALTQHIKEAHPYDVPEVISVAISDGLAPYLDWIGASTAP
eukprot:Sspe_Gene.90924::Locus_62410_Transcript_1_1_Confidence_1.000_Length_788::g.90924::m.90924/K03926/cutA; periplasmic divalent cation tolerance protein